MSGGSLSPARFERDLKKAAERFDVILSTPTTLLVDLDGQEAVKQFYRVLPKVSEVIGVESVETWPSKSGQGHHALVLLKEPWDVRLRIALQALLGSDGIREVLAIGRLREGVKEPSALFRPKDAKREWVSL